MKNRLPLFYAVTAIFWYALYTYVPYVSPYSEYLGADLRLIGLIVGAYGFTQMAIRFPLGILSDRLGKRKIFVLAGLFFAAVSGIVVFFVPSAYAVLLSRSLGGVAAASWVTFAILGASYYPPEEAAKSVGFLNSANALGRILAFLTGGLIAEILGVPFAFLLGGLAGVVGLVAGVWIVETGRSNNRKPKTVDCNLHVVGAGSSRPSSPQEQAVDHTCQPSVNDISSGREDPAPTVCKADTCGQNFTTETSATSDKKEAPTLKDLLSLVGGKQLLAASLLAILSQYIAFATAFGFTPLFGESLGATHFQLGMLGMAAAIPGLVISPLAGTIIPKKIGNRNTIALGFLMAAVGCVLFVFVTNIWQLYAVQVLVSAGLTLAYTLLMGLSIKGIQTQKRATAMGFFQAVYGLGMFIGPFVTGWVGHGFGLSVAFVITGAVGVMGAVAAYVFARCGYIARG